MKINPLTRLSIMIGGFFLVYFTYIGLTTSPWETDSLAYHIPIANNLLRYNFFNIDYQHTPLLLYPGAIELILAVIKWLSLPLNLFNVIAFIFFYFACYYLAKTVNLTKSLSIIFALTCSLLPITIRLLTTQKIDLWLAVFFIFSLTILINQPMKIRDYLLLGLCLGFLIGSKYSGIFFGGLLVVFYWLDLTKNIKISSLLVILIPILILGLSWYFRNYFLTNNPFYFVLNLSNYQLYKLIITDPLTIGQLLIVSLSELLIWSLLILISPFYLIIKVDSKEVSQTKKILILGLMSLGICFILPANIHDFYQWFRFTLCGATLLILSNFKLAQLYGREKLISHLAVFNQLTVLSLINYRPKIIVGYSVCILSAFLTHLIVRKIVEAKTTKSR